jgi:hypothetical protein
VIQGDQVLVALERVVAAALASAEPALFRKRPGDVVEDPVQDDAKTPLPGGGGQRQEVGFVPEAGIDPEVVDGVISVRF